MNSYQDNNETHFKSYRKYFNSGFYKKRYPKPNFRTLSSILNKSDSRKIIVDIGCGDGRYALPVSRVCKSLFALDISEEAVEGLRQEIKENNLKNIEVSIIKPPISLKKVTSKINIDGIIVIFGVLSHIVDAEDRHRLLCEIYDSLNIDGFLILSVPNSCRRFKKEQKIQDSSTITYTRSHQGSVLEFRYKLFQADELHNELRNAGFSKVKIVSESIMPETLVVNSGIMGWLDKLLCAIVPGRWAYGYLVTAIK